MYGERLGRHIALRIEMPMKRLAGGHAIENLDTADFNQPIATQGIEAGGFGIQNDFAHELQPQGSGESGSSLRHLNSLNENVPDSGAHGVKSVRCIHHEMRALALFGVGQLPRQDGI
jgi:hypothetical protein